MKRKILPLFLAVLMLACALILPTSAERISDGASHFAESALLIKSGYIGQTVSFREKDFKQALGTTKIGAITVTALPQVGEGSLLLSSSRIGVGDSIPASALDLLKFVPANETVSESGFTFTAGNLAGGAEITCKIRLTDKKNVAPTVAGGTVSVATQTGISLFGTLDAADADGDALYFRVTAYPSRGTLTILDTETGAFRYTPKDGFSGRDSFTYVARDEYGHFSKEQTVSVTVKKRTSSLVYEDLVGGEHELAAIALSDEGIMLGRLSGDGMYFDPNETVTRGEFTAMVMKTAGIVPSATLYDTCFDDNDTIPSSVRPYIATAQKLGYVRGNFDGTGLYFEADRAVTRAEAAVIICNIMGVATSESAAVLAPDSGIPVWAQAQAGTLYSLGVMSSVSDNEPLMRGEVAQMLYAFLK